MLLVMVAFLVVMVQGVELLPVSEKALHFKGGGAIPGLRMLRGPQLFVPAQTSRRDYDFEQYLGKVNLLTFNYKACVSCNRLSTLGPSCVASPTIHHQVLSSQRRNQ